MVPLTWVPTSTLLTGAMVPVLLMVFWTLPRVISTNWYSVLPLVCRRDRIAARAPRTTSSVMRRSIFFCFMEISRSGIRYGQHPAAGLFGGWRIVRAMSAALTPFGAFLEHLFIFHLLCVI